MINLVVSYKILVIGEGAVGKTSIAQRYTTGAFKESHLITLGANFMLKDLKIENGDNIRLSIWDTAGQERFRKMVESYYKGAKGVIITYDITRRESFEEIAYWYKNTLERVPKAKVALVGNKSDLEDRRLVSSEEGTKLAEEWSALFFETSAKFNKNIDELFQGLTQRIIEEES